MFLYRVNEEWEGDSDGREGNIQGRGQAAAALLSIPGRFAGERGRENFFE